MQKRSIFTFSLMLAFVAGAWGNVLAAAFCPHLGSARACCVKQTNHSSPSSHEMHDAMKDMQMGEMQMDPPSESTQEASPQQAVSTAEPDSDARALEAPAETCAHCFNHSQLPLSSLEMRETDSAKRSAAVIAPQARQQVSLAILPSLILGPREHAPPGKLSPRYILINVFRI